MTELNAQTRTITGSKVKTLRKKGLLPAVIYGEGMETHAIATPFVDFERVFRQAGESTLVTLHVDGKPYNVLIHDVAYDPMRGQPIHADFYAVRMDKPIRAMVPIEFIGESGAVKSEGGVLVKVMHEIEVEALPKDLPHELRVDLALLATFESKVLVKDISLPSGVEITADADEIVVLVEAPRSTEELEMLGEAGGEVAEVKTEQEEKRAAKEAAEKEKEEVK